MTACYGCFYGLPDPGFCKDFAVRSIYADSLYGIMKHLPL